MKRGHIKFHFFKAKGEFKEKRKNDAWWVIKEGAFGNSFWTAGHHKLAYKKRKMKAIVGSAFSGPRVLALKRNTEDPDKINLVFMNRKTGKEIKRIGRAEPFGKIESAHRHVSQERPKIPGACWRLESINPMMALRIIKK